ncbi:Tm-1-like ATP-binding domain-containing protein [Actinophytocola sp.]|uniref:Tm-1-like ATP-binding domain-containing protein n=1 Tax=Actinophytocola sp. TaxID=1872138 RepID=UPI002D4825EB|nr:Tm-1-like ATP-binding domain-containing protein [Actinophytocola sp.]HYQ70219.1 Tm-1-like ATP-binding domain-containing protein [Actinophytocola sp.]
MPTVALLGTFDTKQVEYGWLRERLTEAGCDVLGVDVGTFSDDDGGGLADISAADVASAAGADLGELRAAGDRGAAMAAMADGAAAVVTRLYREGRLDGVLAVGGSGGSSVAGRAMRALPVGVPKLLVSTMASGDVRPYVGDVDVTLMYSVVDISGVNSVSRLVLGNAAAAVAGMAAAHERRRREPERDDGRPVVAATMFGLTTPAVDEARETLAELGYEVLVFHATGAGGRAMESLVTSGLVDGVLDLTTTELADDLVGGVLTAGPERLTAAGRAGVPQVVSVGALDMVNFGPQETVPERFADRKFLVHNATVTLMRTTEEEMAVLGGRIAGKLAAATGPVEVFLPLRGVSGIDTAGGQFEDAAADEACLAEIRTGLAGSAVVVHEVDSHINDKGFGRAAAEALHRLVTNNRGNR